MIWMQHSQLTFVNEAVNQLLSHDALIVLAPGLGIHSIILKFLQDFHIQYGCHPGGLSSSKQGALTPLKPIASSRPRGFVSPGRLLGAPLGSQGAQEGEMNNYYRQPTAEGGSVPCMSDEQKQIGSRLIILLNTSLEEGEVIRSRAKMRGLVGKTDDTLSTPQAKRKKCSALPDELSEESKLPRQKTFAIEDESPIQLRLYLVSSAEASQPEVRQKAYSSGGIFVISSRVLVTDLLCGRLPAEMIDGILVNHAHSLTNAWNSAFILRLFRQKNKRGFVKGFSDRPDILVRGTAPLERILKLMVVPTVHLFPRFHATVDSDLRIESQPSTFEIASELSERMKDVQRCLIGLLKKGLFQIKKLQTVDLSELKLEECCFKKTFEMQLFDGLDPLWSSLPQSYRKLVQDIAIFRQLIVLLIDNDPIQFYSYVESLKAAQSLDSRWLLTAEWEILLKRTTERLFRIVRTPIMQDSKQLLNSSCIETGPLPLVSGIPGKLIPSVEIPPKWDIMTELLKKAATTISKKTIERLAKIQGLLEVSSAKNSVTTTTPKSEASSSSVDEIHDDSSTLSDLPSNRPELRILIVTSEKTFTYKLEQVLLVGPQRMMLSAFRAFIMKEAERRKKFVIGHRTPTTGSADVTLESLCSPGMSNSLLETVLLIKEADRLLTTTLDNDIPRWLSSTDNEEEFNRVFNAQFKDLNPLITPRIRVTSFPTIPGAFELELRQFCPHHLILIQPDICRVREIETYCAELYSRVPTSFKKSASECESLVEDEVKVETMTTTDQEIQIVAIEDDPPPFLFGHEIEVSILVFKGTIEHQQYLYSLQQERTAWTNLIQQKQFLVVPLNEEVVLDNSTFEELVSGFRPINTRQAGGQKMKNHTVLKPSVVVDLREFRSSLPFQIYCRGMDVVPVTLLVGDYVLSRDVCVERKSLSDFIQSINSGRLFDQAKEMTKVYGDAALLIEFGARQAFSLQSRELLGTQNDNSDLLMKLSLLILSFPQLRLIWSPTASFTADMFCTLKEGRENPDPFRAALLGSIDDDDQNETSYDRSMKDGFHHKRQRHEHPKKIQLEVGDQALDVKELPMMACDNSAAIDLLRKLPGVTNRNAHILIRHITKLSDLITVEKDVLKSLIGEEQGTQLAEFLEYEFTF